MAKNQHSFWQSAANASFYVVKHKKGLDYLSPENAVDDHIAYAVYRLFGVDIPPYYIGHYQRKLSLVSKIPPGYEDLIACFNCENPLEKINQNSTVEGCIATYQEMEKPLAITGKEALLAAATFLEDGDVLGAGLRNVGIIKDAKNHQIIKIDPSSQTFYSATRDTVKLLQDFKNSLNLAEPLLCNSFSFTAAYNNPGCILGNLHFSEFFQDINTAALKDVYAKFTSLDDSVLYKMIVRDEYIDVLNCNGAKEYLENIYQILVEKKSILQDALKLPKVEYTAPEPPVVFADNMRLGEPMETIIYGASHPIKVQRIRSDKSNDLQVNSSASVEKTPTKGRSFST